MKEIRNTFVSFGCIRGFVSRYVRFILASVLMIFVLLPNISFAQTTQNAADPQNDWLTSSPWVAVPPHAPFAEQKVYLGRDSRKPYQVLIFEQTDSAMNGGNASQLMYFYKWVNFNTPSPIPSYVEIEACTEDVSKNPDIQIMLYVYFGNTRTGEFAQSGTKILLKDWAKYLFDFNWSGVPKQYNIFAIGIMMGPSNQRMTSKAGLYQINYYDPSMNLTWNYNLITDVPHETLIPTEFSLSQNYPNPFNPATTIKFTIPTTELVSLKVYDLLGREVAALVNEEKAPGTYEAKFDGSNLASGMYVYRLQADNFVSVKKMILMK